MAAHHFAADGGSVRKVGGFENIIYQFEQGGVPRIMRFSHSARREEREILSELDWLLHLHKHDLQVCAPIASSDDRLVVPIDDGADGQFLVSVFERAPGRHLNGQDHEWGASLFEEWGKVTASFHEASRNYVVPPHLPRRGNDEGETEPEQLQTLSAAEQMLEAAFMRSLHETEQLPKGGTDYGMCHRDLHHGNFKVHKGRIIAFDFDDCRFDYYAQDLAMAIYYGTIFNVWEAPLSDPLQAEEQAGRFVAAFLHGYAQIGHPDQQMLRQIPLFIEKRRCDLAMMLYPHWSKHGTDGQKRWLTASVTQINNGVPCMRLPELV